MGEGRRAARFRTADFGGLFPELSDCVVETTERGEGLAEGGKAGRASFRDRTIEGLVRCSNPGCRGGGFDLGTPLASLVEGRRAEGRSEIACAGGIGSRRSERGPDPCPNRLEVSFRLKYRSV